jgi:hypothetical protein
MIFEKERFTDVINDWQRYWLMISLVIITLCTLIFLPIEIKSIQISIDSKNVYFIVLVILVFIMKLVSIIDWYFIVFHILDMHILHLIITGLGTFVILVSAIVTGIEIYIAMKDQEIGLILAAIFLHPSMLNFEVFLLCAIAPIVVLLTKNYGSNEYSEIPQMVYPMEQFNEMRFIAPDSQPVFDPSSMYPMNVLREPYFVNAASETKEEKKPTTTSFIPYYVSS